MRDKMNQQSSGLQMASQQASGKKIAQIIYDQFMEQYNDPRKATAAVNMIAQKVQQPGFKLMNFGDVLFTVAVADQHMAEIHAMIGGKHSEAEKMKLLDKALDQLLKNVPKLGIQLVYTYMPKNKVSKFEKILKGYKFTEKPINQNGQDFVAFYIGVGNVSKHRR